MNKKLLLTVSAFLLMGQGCLFGGDGPQAPDGGLWSTIDAGKTWVHLNVLPGQTGVTSIGGVNATSIEIDPSDHSVYYLGTEANGLFYSYDSGATWMRPEDGEAKAGWVMNTEVHPEDVCTIYVLKSDRLLKSTDCARTFASVYVETRTDEWLTDLSLDWFNPETLWISGSAGDVVRSQDAGASWQQVYNADDQIVDLIVSTSDSRIVLVGTEDRGVHRTADGGATWVANERDLRSEFESADRVYGFTQTNDGSVLIMNTKFGLLRSTDQGETWTAVPETPAADERIWSVAVHPTDPNTIYFGTLNILYQSTNGGDAWTTNELPSTRAPRTMIVHPSTTSTLLVGFAAVED